MKTKGPHYTTSMFDVPAWFKVIGGARFAHISTVASIRLGKPTQNGFLERVFSHGTYQDDILQKKLKADKLKMSVLDSLNLAKCESLLKYMGELHEKRNDDDAEYVWQFFETTEVSSSTSMSVPNKDRRTGETIVVVEIDDDGDLDSSGMSDDYTSTGFLPKSGFLSTVGIRLDETISSRMERY
jgi:pimeloyl-CoA synthetase